MKDPETGEIDYEEMRAVAREHKPKIVLAGFYSERLAFTFPPAFMREARIRIAAEFTKSDSEAVRDLVETGRLSLDGLITDRASASDASDAYRKAFTDPDCVKMVLDWRHVQ